MAFLRAVSAGRICQLMRRIYPRPVHALTSKSSHLRIFHYDILMKSAQEFHPNLSQRTNIKISRKLLQVARCLFVSSTQAQGAEMCHASNNRRTRGGLEIHLAV